MLKVSGTAIERDVKQNVMRAKVFRADGTIEPERIVAYSHKNPLINFFGSKAAWMNGWFWDKWYTRKRRQRK